MNKRLAKVLELEAIDLERINPAAARAVRNHLLKFMTESQYNDMWCDQDGKCAICKQECPTNKALSIDHCHKTGRISGLLCNRCNMALGAFQDNPLLLEKAIYYLKNNTICE